MMSGQRLSQSSRDPLKDPSKYQSIIGSLLYLYITRPDITYFVNRMSQFLATPTTDHLR
jgi:hypothetical protein